MREQVPVSDAVDDFKRTFAVRSVLVRFGCVAAMLLSLSQLQGGDLTVGALAVWVLLPIPFLVLGAMEWGRYEQRADELQREIVRDANSVAFRWTLVALCMLLLLDRAFNVPWVVRLGGGLPDLTVTWEAALLVGLLVWTTAFARSHRRRVAG